MTPQIALITDALVRATPLIIAGLAVAIAFRGGVFNIGAEGQLLLGAVAATAVTLKLNAVLGPATVVVATCAGALAGAFWAGIAAELRRRFHVLEIISTIMLNFIAIHLVSYLVRGPLQEPTRIYPQTETFPTFSRLPILIPGTRLHSGFALAIVLAVALAWVLSRTSTGFRIKAVGASPRAAESAGQIDVAKTSFNVFLLSGAIAGIAGSIEVSGVTFALYENLSPGYGYTAIAVALIAGLNPLATIAAGMFFGMLETSAIALQRELAVPSSLAAVVEAAMILSVLAAAVVRGKSLLGRKAAA
jgi:simple sugar transport system permease protein